MDLTVADRLGGRLERVLGGAAEPPASWAVDGRVPRWVVQPSSEEELAAAVRVIAEERAAAVVWGGGTRVGVGAPPARYDVALSVRRLARVVRHDPADLTVTVEAGCTAAALAAHVASSGQRLEADVPFAARATIGGTLAGGASGAREGPLGALRNLVLGAGAVDATGRVTRTGGRVVKNVTGFDLHRLYARSFGTLVVLTQLHLRLAPLPARRVLAAACYADAAGAAQAAERARLAPIRPTGLAVLSPGLWRGIVDQSDGAAEVSGWWLVAGWEGAAEAVEAAGAHAAPWWKGATDLREAEAETADDIWQRIADFTAGDAEGRPDVPGAAGDGTPLRLAIGLPPASAAPFVTNLARETACEVLWLPERGRIVVHAGVPQGGVPAIEAWIDGLRAAAAAADGWLVGERLPAAWKTPDRVWGPPPAHQPLLERVKLALDPAGTLAPGRLAGGL